MNNIGHILRWCFRAWPVWLIIDIGILHIFLLSFSPINDEILNSIISQVLLVVGALFILLSLNASIIDFRKTGMFSLFINYIKEFPHIKRKTVHGAVASLLGDSTLKATASVKRNWNNTDEGILELERRIDELNGRLSSMNQEIEKKISNCENDLSTQIAGNNKEISKVAELLEKTIMGNINYQVFGVLLILYGVAISIFQILNTSK